VGCKGTLLVPRKRRLVHTPTTLAVEDGQRVRVSGAPAVTYGWVTGPRTVQVKRSSAWDRPPEADDLITVDGDQRTIIDVEDTDLALVLTCSS